MAGSRWRQIQKHGGRQIQEHGGDKFKSTVADKSKRWSSSTQASTPSPNQPTPIIHTQPPSPPHTQPQEQNSTHCLPYQGELRRRNRSCPTERGSVQHCSLARQTATQSAVLDQPQRIECITCRLLFCLFFDVLESVRRITVDRVCRIGRPHIQTSFCGKYRFVKLRSQILNGFCPYGGHNGEICRSRVGLKHFQQFPQCVLGFKVFGQYSGFAGLGAVNRCLHIAREPQNIFRRSLAFLKALETFEIRQTWCS